MANRYTWSMDDRVLLARKLLSLCETRFYPTPAIIRDLNATSFRVMSILRRLVFLDVLAGTKKQGYLRTTLEVPQDLASCFRLARPAIHKVHEDLPPLTHRRCRSCKCQLHANRYFHCVVCQPTLPPDEDSLIYFALPTEMEDDYELGAPLE
jgi:hypothetical protein